MRLSVAKWGNSLAVRLPKEAAEKMGVSEGSALDFDVNENGSATLRPKKLNIPRYDINELVAAMKPENQHPLIWEDDPPRGSEFW